MRSVSIVLTHEEAVEIFRKTSKGHREYTGLNEEDEVQTEAEWAYHWMGFGRSAWGVKWNDINSRCSKLLKKLIKEFGREEDLEDILLFRAEKEVYPPVFALGPY
jgi:hypothetical protein